MSLAQQPMVRVCARLQALGTDLGACHALEFFARAGDWHTMTYAPKVARLDAWEIDPGFEAALRANLPRARIRIADSFDLARRREFAGQFDSVVYDNPQMFFGKDGQYCEHFEAIDTLSALLRPRGVTIFNVNIVPFDYDLWERWRTRRNEFYRLSDASHLEETFVLDFYRRHLQERGITTRNAFLEPRYKSPIHYFVALLER